MSLDHLSNLPWVAVSTAVGVTFIGAVWTPWAYVIGFVISAVAFAGWGWPRGTDPEHQVVAGRLPSTEPR